jgi:hypothetical protein
MGCPENVKRNVWIRGDCKMSPLNDKKIKSKTIFSTEGISALKQIKKGVRREDYF